MTDEELDPLAYVGILPGTRVKIFDHRLYKDDKKTPLSMTMKEATVIRHYGEQARSYGEDLVLGPYSSCIDVVFDHRPESESKGHATWGIHILEHQGQFDTQFLAEYNKRFVIQD